MAEFIETRKSQITHQKGRKLFAVGRVHIAISVPLLNVAHVQRVILFGKYRAHQANLNVLITLKNAPLLAIRAELRGRDARWDAGGATLAVRAIEVVAAATKAHFRKLSINIRIHGLAWVEEQGCRLLIGQIAAGVRLSGIKLQAGQLSHDRLSGSVLN